MRRVVVIALCILLSVLVSCSCSGPAVSSGGGRQRGDVDTSAFEPWLLEVYEDDGSETVEIIEDSRSLIVEALQNEEISEEEYLVLRFQEAFEPETLPKAYQSDERGPRPIDNSFLFYMLRTRWDEFSPETKEALNKYHVPSWDEESVWYDPEAENDQSIGRTVDDLVAADGELAAPMHQFIDWLTIIPAANAVTNKASNGKDFIVNYVSSADMPKAIIIADALEKAYDKYKAAGMAEPTDWIWVRLQSLGGDLGVEQLDNVMNDGVDRCTIRIEKNQDKEHLETTAAHELFHCFQETMQLPNYATEEWMWESTAVWSEEYVFPGHNTEHDYDPTYFITLNKDFLDEVGNKHYGAYIWWFYLYQKHGKSIAPVLKGLKDVKGQTRSRNSLKNRPGWYDEHKEFALWNLNSEPFMYYQDSDHKPSESPGGQSKERRDVAKGQEFDMDVDMDTGGMKYFYYFIADDIDKLKFNLEAGNKNAHDKLGVQMIYKVGDLLLYEDVSSQDEVVFCRGRRSERVDAVVFIVNNADLDDMFIGKHEVDATEECAPGWSGHTILSWTDSGSKSDLPTLSGDPVFGSWSERGVISIRDELIYDKDEDEFIITKTSYSYSHNEQQSVSYSRSCGLLYESDSNTMSGSGTKTWEVDKDKLWDNRAPERFESADEGPGIYEVSLDPVVGSFTSHSQSIEQRNTCPLWGVSTPVPAEFSSQVWDNNYNSEEQGYIPVADPNIYDLRAVLSEDRKSLTGRGEANFVYDGREVPVHVIIDYSYG